MKPLKQFGQHFLTDNSIADKIVAAAELCPQDTVWEIGPGKGILTERIIQMTTHLTAFEIDYRLNELLSHKYGTGLHLINRDILAVNWQELLQEDKDSGRKVKLVSNLPYQITSPVLYKLEEQAESFSRIVIMVQREVADRLTAQAGTKAYSPLTLKLGYYFEVRNLLQVPPDAFEPAPKVHSTVVLLTPRLNKPAIKSLDTYRHIVNRAFSQRRKTLRNNLRIDYLPEQLKWLEEQSGINFNRRGETLGEEEFIRLADLVVAYPGKRSSTD